MSFSAHCSGIYKVDGLLWKGLHGIPTMPWGFDVQWYVETSFRIYVCTVVECWILVEIVLTS